MKDLLAPFLWHWFCLGRIAIREHRDDVAAKASFIELKRGLALTAKRKKRVPFHRALLKRSATSSWLISNVPLELIC
jgi:hypothetical protein